MYRGQKLQKYQFFVTFIKNNILTREVINCFIAFQSRLCALCRPNSAMNIWKRVGDLRLLLRRYSTFRVFFKRMPWSPSGTAEKLIFEF
jgi:hypothetical protein